MASRQWPGKAKMIEQLKSFFSQFDQAEVSNPQSEAILELLVWTMYIDQSIKVSEEVELAHQASALAWGGLRSRHQFVDEAGRRIKGLLGDEIATYQRLEALGLQLGTAALKERALLACESLARADGEYHDREQRWLEALRRAFKV